MATTTMENVTSEMSVPEKKRVKVPTFRFNKRPFGKSDCVYNEEGKKNLQEVRFRSEDSDVLRDGLTLSTILLLLGRPPKLWMESRP